MKNNPFLNYFKLSFKRSIKMSLVYFVIMTLVYIIPLLIMKGPETTNVGLIITTLAFITYIDPHIQTSYLMKKKSIDTYYALPILRHQLLLSKILIGIIQVLIPFTIIYFLGIVVSAVKFPLFNFIYYLPLYFILVLIFICIYIINFFFITRANNENDGFMFMLFGTFVIALGIFSFAIVILGNILDATSLNYLADYVMEKSVYFIPFASFIVYGNYFDALIKDNYVLMSPVSYNFNNNLPYLIVLIVLAISCAVGLWFLIKKEKPERAEELSQSKFGYSVMVPFYAACGLLTLSSIGEITITIISMVIVTILYLVCSFLQYRTVKIPIKCYIILGIILVAGFIISLTRV